MRRYAALGHLAAPLRFRDAVLAAHAETPFDVVEATNWLPPQSCCGADGTAARHPQFHPAAWSREAAQSPRKPVRQLGGGTAWSAARPRAVLPHLEHREHGGGSRRCMRLQQRGAVGSKPMKRIGLSLASSVLERAARAAYPRGAAPQHPLRRPWPNRGKASRACGRCRTSRSARGARRASGFPRRASRSPEADLPANLDPRTRRHLNPLGRQPDGVLFDLYEAAHFVAAPSRYESFGLVYQEAIAFGRPVVASAEDPSARAFIGKTGAGLLAEADGRASIAKQLAAPAPVRRAAQPGPQAGAGGAGTFTPRHAGRADGGLYRKAIANAAASRA